MLNQDIKSGLFGSIGENMVAFELAKRNWFVYRPYFDTRIDFIAQKFVCKKCFSDWESKHIVSCSDKNCKNFLKDLNQKDYLKTRKCLDCGYIFNKYTTEHDCPKCDTKMTSNLITTSGQRNYQFTCNFCKHSFSSQTRSCVKCGSNNCVEYPVCKICGSEIKPRNTKCQNPGCDSIDYALIIRTIQVKSSHEEEGGKIGFNFKLQDLIDDERHFLVVYSRTFEDYKEKHNFWVMSVDEFNNEMLSESASKLIYQNARLHPPTNKSQSFFNEIEYNKCTFDLEKARKRKEINKIIEIEKQLQKVDVFAKLNRFIKGDF
ncbi:MAG: hypothetical protein A2X61_15825 [Ignavibacteria bacterium GWB2_35_12]|nr:MAG: hypothetical protein A2X63_10785 [Ignavibacteria bacterium GWA2_35_8]OGU40842.1 MAG: hypothetical protein A2X61_15825 [Ignavibacteria bacterium GWB2_35_12]OGU87134.1 MAG: hypothetical protein A2220_08200 [Ignavibacteria bacterium RIFOXYA2_FULL_35_10]OGV24669.1 MAG: hypothetical protein A2475_14600 [Ignavibacteria bacterium RIFOXYC2_FULL_35_21]